MDSTLIKWPGGKASEYETVKAAIPDYKRYVEPFFGGGAVFFKEEPERAAINDLNTYLMDFYRMIKNEDEQFASYLHGLAEAWDMNTYRDAVNDELKDIFLQYRRDEIDKDAIDEQVHEHLEEHEEEFKKAFDDDLVLDDDALFDHISETVAAKIKRIKRVEEKKQQLPDEDVQNNIETGLRSGFYNHYRALLNDVRLERRDLEAPVVSAIFYFVREFCYGSMFRYNSDGEFNIPYGGMSYNDKSFTDKVERLLSDRVVGLFADAMICNRDFETFLEDCELTDDDFVFFDPPYDTDFSTYGGNAFGKDDHERLADAFEQMDADGLMIIKATEFIRNLYQERGLTITSFEKTYSYNVRGRNDQETEHLVITNYEPDTPDD